MIHLYGRTKKSVMLRTQSKEDHLVYTWYLVRRWGGVNNGETLTSFNHRLKRQYKPLPELHGDILI